ncbi:hypothetical protein [Singulisphaera acidiphila]|uniref:Glycosyltransferase RgtA/B/C/D-like domain-containing protein n=1 Tax=Singulisphaera acidiphila (strain ATCC BAA-1392 / DSM 18658 / VKM B-2454 / MOB10) TaxID=886293 RepID=L0D8V4_SINAD|nr:hypothetical protein [Singulisphaera acidiphila]AGA25066.1 hypothetical protein Sinac_0651 [Singulisphaera acidiphila DSM 18658]
MSSTTLLASETDSARSRRWGLRVFVVALSPALIAIWATPWFVTQDGPAHLYNAQIITRSFETHSLFSDVYHVRWEPLPNWVGHLSLTLLLRVMPARVADRVMTTLTLIGFAASIVWLRWRVVGWRGMPLAALLAVLLAINLPWLLGFTSFMLGACLFPITLGIWWHGRERLWPGRVAVLWALMVLGYFNHLVSLGLTVVGLVVLAFFAPGERRFARAGWTALGLLPLVPLGWIYLGLTRNGGPMKPVWKHLSDPFSLSSWHAQLSWAEPISLASKVVLPFYPGSHFGFALLTPLIAFAIALVLEGITMLRERGASRGPTTWPDRRGWGVLAAVLILGGMAGPDTLGESHGNYLPQRVLLFGLVALVPLLDLEAKTWTGRAAALALVWAVAIQSAFLWEYAATSNRNVSALLQARAAIGTNQKVATLLMGIPSRFRSNSILHADNLLGVDTGNVIWNNYETRHYYFPVQFNPAVDRPDSETLELLALKVDHDEDRPLLWYLMLEAHHQSIDAILTWGKNAELDQISDRWFKPVYENGNVRVLRHR